MATTRGRIKKDTQTYLTTTTAPFAEEERLLLSFLSLSLLLLLLFWMEKGPEVGDLGVKTVYKHTQ